MLFIIISLVVVVIVYFYNSFNRDLKIVKENPFLSVYETFTQKLNEKFYGNSGKIIEINSMEFYLVPPADSFFVIKLKIKYTGRHIRVIAINTSFFEEKIEYDYTFNLNEVVHPKEQEIMAERYAELYIKSIN